MEQIPPFVMIESPRRRHCALRLRSDGVIELLAPAGLGMAEARQILADNRAAVRRLQSRAPRRTADPHTFTQGDRFLYLGSEYPVRFTQRLLAFDPAGFFVPGGSPEAVAGDLQKLYRKIALGYFSVRVPELAEYCGVSVGTIRIGSARHRWGCCAGNGDLTFSWRLIQCPRELVDYVICHELAHRLEFNHSDRFYRILKAWCPDSDRLRAMLKSFPRSSRFWA